MKIQVFAQGRHQKPFSPLLAAYLVVAAIAVLTLFAVATGHKPPPVVAATGAHEMSGMAPHGKPNKTTTTVATTIPETTEAPQSSTTAPSETTVGGTSPPPSSRQTTTTVTTNGCK